MMKTKSSISLFIILMWITLTCAILHMRNNFVLHRLSFLIPHSTYLTQTKVQDSQNKFAPTLCHYEWLVQMSNQKVCFWLLLTYLVVTEIVQQMKKETHNQYRNQIPFTSLRRQVNELCVRSVLFHRFSRLLLIVMVNSWWESLFWTPCFWSKALCNTHSRPTPPSARQSSSSPPGTGGFHKPTGDERRTGHRSVRRTRPPPRCCPAGIWWPSPSDFPIRSWFLAWGDKCASRRCLVLVWEEVRSKSWTPAGAGFASKSTSSPSLSETLNTPGFCSTSPDTQSRPGSLLCIATGAQLDPVLRTRCSSSRPPHTGSPGPDGVCFRP